jgi:hypothetical protein
VARNGSRPGQARLDFVVTDVPRGLFTGTGDSFGDTGAGHGRQLDLIGVANDPGTIGVGDEVAVDRFSITFSDANGDIRTFGADNAQIVAQEILAADGTSTGARQDVVWVLFSIRNQTAGELQTIQQQEWKDLQTLHEEEIADFQKVDKGFQDQLAAGNLSNEQINTLLAQQKNNLETLSSSLARHEVDRLGTQAKHGSEKAVTDVSDPNLVPGSSTAEMRVAGQDGLGFTVLGVWNLTGDGSIDDAQDVVITPTGSN